MITEKEIEYALQHKKVYLKPGLKLIYWVSRIFTLALPISFMFLPKQDKAAIWGASIVALVVLVFVILDSIRFRRFRVVKLNISADQFKQAAKATAKLQGWKELTINGEQMKVWDNIFWQKGVYHVIAFRTENEVYINSRLSPSLYASFIGNAINLSNVNTLVRQLEAASKGVDVIKEAELALSGKKRA